MSEKVLQVSERIKISKEAILIKTLTITAVMILMTSFSVLCKPITQYIQGRITTSDGCALLLRYRKAGAR